MLFHAKVILFVVALVVLAAFSVDALAWYYRVTGFVVLLMLSGWLVRIRLGASGLRGLLRIVVVTFSVWTIAAFIIGTFYPRDESYLSWVWWNGPFKALRFSTCILLAAYALATFDPQEIMDAPLVPATARRFVLLFRAFVLRLKDVLSDAILQVHALGVPHFGHLILACIMPGRAYPVQSPRQLKMLQRWHTTASIMLHLMLYLLEQLILVEIPEVDAAVDEAFAGQRRSSDA